MGRLVDECFEPGKLLEESWFFGNLLERKPEKMSRSFSDPCSSFLSGKSFEETYKSIEKLPEPNRKTFSDNLPRTPSLPISLRIEEYQDEETDFSMGKLIRQASLTNSGTKRSAQPVQDVVTFNSIKSRRNPDMQSPIIQIKTQKSLTGLELSQFQGFKDMGFDFDNKCSIKNISSSKQEEEIMEEHEDKNSRRRLYRSETVIPKWASKMSTEDMKAQLKFWARAVASNVRQEC